LFLLDKGLTYEGYQMKDVSGFEMGIQNNQIDLRAEQKRLQFGR